MKMKRGPTVVFVLATLLLVSFIAAVQRTDAHYLSRQKQAPDQARQIYRAARDLLERVDARAGTLTLEETDQWQPLLDECQLDVRRLEAEYPPFQQEYRR
jgi:hypothetical protein